MGRVRNAVSTRRYRLRRAIERGDPRLGMIVGVLLAAASAWIFVRRDLVGAAETLEVKTLDVAFRRRAPIVESDKLVLVDIDDTTLRELEWPMPREYYAKAVLALDRLGARHIVFDVQFKTTIRPPDKFDERTGEYLLDDADRSLQSAIGRSGKVTLAYSYDVENPLSSAVRQAFPALKAVFAKNPAALLEEAALLSGLGAEALRNELERVRERALVELVGEAMARRPQAGFLDLRKEFLPDYDPRRHHRELKLLQYGYALRRCQALLDAKTAPMKLEAGATGDFQPQAVFAPFYPFLEQAEGVGCVNAQSDSDGVMRRPAMFFRIGDRAYPYLGLQMGLKELETPELRVETAVRPQAVEIRRIGRSDGAVRSTTILPIDGQGRLFVNWVGNSDRMRGKQDYFAHLSLLKIVQFYQMRVEVLDENVRRTLDQLPEESRTAVQGDKYVRLSDRYRELLKGGREATPGEARSVEERMEKIRSKMIGEFNDYIAAMDERLAKITSPRAKEQGGKERAKWVEQVTAITAPDDLERELRSIVAGKTCLIGSAATASGDLHAIPLGSATPGMDILANVANMSLTGQTLRHAPPWVNFGYLLIVGLVVSFFVTHFSTVSSAAATAATIVASGAFFWALFTGPAILVPGAGPVVTAVLTFAGVTAYKELLTQRSKRKLQRELEKNTSAELVKILLEHPEFLSQARRMTGTFFFSDVKSFTSITEKMDAEVLFPFINRYLDRVTQELRNHQAFVDKYIGDGIMALFGIPVPTPDHARLGCKAALDCQAALRPLNAEFKLEGLPEVKMRIGIHSGEVRAGNVGSLERSNYTVLGDNVNLAARLEGANKEYDTSVMISEATWELVAGKFVARELDTIRVVGKRKPVRIFELLGVAGSPPPMEPAFLEAYAAALAKFKERQWAEAIGAFQKAMELKPGDRPSQTYIERAKVFQLMPPPSDWEGVFELTSK